MSKLTVIRAKPFYTHQGCMVEVDAAMVREYGRPTIIEHITISCPQPFVEGDVRPEIELLP